MGNLSRMQRSDTHLALTALALVVVIAAASGCGAKDKSYNGHGVSFHYPRSWEKAQFTGQSAKNASGLWTEAFKPHSSSSAADMIFITEFRTPVSITRQNREIYTEEVSSSVSIVAKRAGGALLAGPAMVSMGGLPGYGFRISAKTRDALSSRSRILLVWHGRTEYYLNCQHDTAGGYAVEIEHACAEIVGSFKLN